MDRDRNREPELLSGYTGEQEVKPEDRSTPALTKGGETAGQNRGQPTPHEGSGGVVGSGAGAGGGGGPEEYDSDPQAGGGKLNGDNCGDGAKEGGDAAKHGSR